MHCRFQMVSRFDKALFVLRSVASSTLTVAFVQKKGIVLSKPILIIRQSDEHCTSVKGPLEQIRIVDVY